MRFKFGMLPQLGILIYLCAILFAPVTSGLFTGSPLVLATHQYKRHDCIERGIIRYLRDQIIRTIWDAPVKQSNPLTPSINTPSSSAPPSTHIAQYGGDVVLRFQIQNAEEAEALVEAVHVLLLDVWEFNREWVDIRLSRDIVPALLGLLPSSLQRAHTPLMHDLAQTIYESFPSPTSKVKPTMKVIHPGFPSSLRSSTDESNIFFNDYQPLSVIIPWMRLLHSLFSTHARMISIGTTFEGRDIPALRVGVHSTNSEKPSGPRKTIIITGGAHAREWISTSTVNYVAYSLITAYGKSKSMTKFLEKIDWVFIPTLNPDGYVYTWEHDRLWRKNRQQTNLRFCKGVDLDRTFGFEWDGQESKSNPCSESFSGESPFEGVESRRFANWVKNETESGAMQVVGFLDFHSYSQQILYPYSFSCTSAPPSLEDLEEVAMGLAKAIRQTSGEVYGVTSACEGSAISSPSSRRSGPSASGDSSLWPRIESGGGSALDWLYHEMHVRYAFQIKLGDTGSYGFLLPSIHIVPTGKEAFAAVKYFGQYILGNKGIELEENEDDQDQGHFEDQKRQASYMGQKPIFFQSSNLEASRSPVPVKKEVQEITDDYVMVEHDKVDWELRKQK